MHDLEPILRQLKLLAENKSLGVWVCGQAANFHEYLIFLSRKRNMPFAIENGVGIELRVPEWLPILKHLGINVQVSSLGRWVVVQYQDNLKQWTLRVDVLSANFWYYRRDKNRVNAEALHEYYH